MEQRGPVVAWLRLWGCADPAAGSYFCGDDCALCKAPWTMFQRKPADAFRWR